MKRRFCLLGLLLGAVGFLAALTPGMIPRPWFLQGLIAGIAFAALYGLSVVLTDLWQWLGLPVLEGQHRNRAGVVLVALGAGIIGVGLWHVADWQNSVHAVMGLPPVQTGQPFGIAGLGATTAVVLIIIGKGCRWLATLVSIRLRAIIPQRLSMLIGVALTGTLLFTLANGVLLRSLIRAMDTTYQRIDVLIPPELSPPVEPWQTGSAASLVDWRSLGLEGRNRVLSYPSRADIEAATGRSSKEPLRVYIGLNSAEGPAARAALALAEMKRIGAFDRAILVIATPTGTGWIDPASMAPVEMLFQGDVASVSVQYSYLPSWLSLFVEPELGSETAREVFRAVDGHWRNLPKDSRPRLYLSGLSLGSLNSDLAADFFDIVSDPYHGAFWIGSPFASRTWQQVIRERQPETPVWAPQFRDSALIRILTGRNVQPALPEWGTMRIAYLNYPSDPIVYFETKSLWRRPLWMREPRAADISAQVRWLPVVSFLQHGLDMMIATKAPLGFGHVYAARDYLDGWVAVTAPRDWDERRLEYLRKAFNGRGL